MRAKCPRLIWAYSDRISDNSSGQRWQLYLEGARGGGRSRRGGLVAADAKPARLAGVDKRTP
eukprot:9489438-Pyramimonas_sp.AAC.1